MIMCVLLCYPVSIRIYYQQGGLFLVPKYVVDFMYTLFVGEAPERCPLSGSLKTFKANLIILT